MLRISCPVPVAVHGPVLFGDVATVVVGRHHHIASIAQPLTSHADVADSDAFGN